MKSQKYFWLKLKKDFFKRHDIRIIEDMEDGKEFVLFYMKLLVESIDHNGNLRFNDDIPYEYTMLATITNSTLDVTERAMKVLTDLDMLETKPCGTIFMNGIEGMIGNRTHVADRVEKHRNDKPLLPCNNDVTESNITVTQSKIIELDKDKDIGNKKDYSLAVDMPRKKTPKPKPTIPPSLKEVSDFIAKNKYNVDIQTWFNHYETVGWLVGKSKMKSWEASVRSWHSRNKETPKTHIPSKPRRNEALEKMAKWEKDAANGVDK